MALRGHFLLQTRSRAGFSRHGLRLLLSAALLSLLVSCTFNTLYRQIDWLVPWHLNDYVSIDESQRSELEQRLYEQLQWHCSTQLNDYATWFLQMHREPHPFSRDDLERHYRRSLEFWRTLMAQLSPDIAELLRTASDEQVRELVDNLERRNRELERRYVTASWKRVQQRRVERMNDILERWIGALNRTQHEALIRWARDLGHSGEDWIESRRRWQQALKEALAIRSDRERFAERIQVLFADPRQLWPEAYHLEYARLRARTLDMLAEVAAAETPGQQHYFKSQLLAWAEDFEQLSCRSPEVAEGGERD